MENEKSYFTLEEFGKNRILEDPLNSIQFYSKEHKRYEFESKINTGEKEEIRLLACDYYRAGSTGNNMNLDCFAFRLIPRTYGYERHLVYLKRYHNMNMNSNIIEIRRLFDDFDCNYIVLGCYGISMCLYDKLCTDVDDFKRNKIYGGFSSINNKDLQSRAKNNSLKKIWTITPLETNQINVSLKNNLEQGKIKLLKDIGVSKGSYALTTDLVNQMTKLKCKIDSEGNIRLLGNKALCSCLLYGNFIADILEAENYNNKTMNELIKRQYSRVNNDKSPSEYIYTNNEDMISLSLLGYKTSEIKLILNAEHGDKNKKDIIKEYFIIFKELENLNGSLVISNIDFATRKIIIENTCREKFLGFRIRFISKFGQELKKIHTNKNK